MQRPGFGGSIADRPRSVEAAFEGDGPGAPSRTGDQRFLEKPAQLKNLSRAPGIGSVLLHAQECFGFMSQGVLTALVPFGPCSEVRDGAIRPGLQVLRSAKAIANAFHKLIPGLAADDQTSTDERRQRRLDLPDFRDGTDVPGLKQHARQRRQRQQRAPLLLVGRRHQVHHGSLRDDARRLVEREALLADDSSGLQDSKRIPFNGRTESRCGRSLCHVERALELPLEQRHGILCGQAFQSDAAHLTPEAPFSRGHNERGSRSNIEYLFQLVLRQVSVVEKNQRLLVLKATPNLGFSRFTERVALVEGFKEQLLEIEGRVMPRRQVDDAVHKRCGSGMMGEVAKNRRLPYSRLAARLDGKACVESRQRRRHIRLAIDKAPNQPRAKENGRGAGPEVCPFGAQGFTDDGAAWVAEL